MHCSPFKSIVCLSPCDFLLCFMVIYDLQMPRKYKTCLLHYHSLSSFCDYLPPVTVMKYLRLLFYKDKSLVQLTALEATIQPWENPLLWATDEMSMVRKIQRSKLLISWPRMKEREREGDAGHTVLQVHLPVSQGPPTRPYLLAILSPLNVDTWWPSLYG